MRNSIMVVFFLTGGLYAVGQEQDSTLKKEPRMLEEVQVSAGSFEASDRAKGASLTPIDAVTVAGSNNNLSQALRALPGVQQIGEREGLFVRGGTGEETKQFMDGILIKHPNYPSVPGLPQYARVDPFLFKGILFSTGGYSALYGQAMSSALILESIDIPEATEASFSLFPANVGAGFQRRADDGNSGYGLNLAYSNHRLYIVPQESDYFAGPSYLQGDAHFRVRTGDRGLVKIYTNWNGSEVGLTRPDLTQESGHTSYSVRGRNTFNNASVIRYFGNNWKMDVSAGYSFLRTAIQDEGAGRSDMDEHFAQLRAVFTKGFARNQAVRFGAEHFYTHETGT